MSDAVVPVLSGKAPADLVELGRVTAAYGIKGWVKIQPHSSHAGVLRTVRQWWLARSAAESSARGVVTSGPAAAPVAYQVLQARPQGATVVAQLAGITDRDQAEALQGWVVQAPRSAFPPTDPDEYYWVDLIGCAFFSNAAGQACRVGFVDDVLDNGAHAVLKVILQQAGTPGNPPDTLLDAKGCPQELLVPFVRAHILDVDLVQRRIDSDWPTEL